MSLMDPKYIVFKDERGEHIVIFDAGVRHDSFKIPKKRIVSAGQLRIRKGVACVYIVAHGDSVTLKKQSREKDAALAIRALNIDGGE